MSNQDLYPDVMIEIKVKLNETSEYVTVCTDAEWYIGKKLSIFVLERVLEALRQRAERREKRVESLRKVWCPESIIAHAQQMHVEAAQDYILLQEAFQSVLHRGSKIEEALKRLEAEEETE